MSFELEIFWTVAFIVMLSAAIAGNIIVIWSVTAHKRMRTVTNYFLINLSLSDLMMAIFNCMFNFVYMLNKNWSFGTSYCTINNFVANVTVAASVFTLSAITVDRYLAITRPLKPRMTKANAQVGIVVIWLASTIVGLPCLIYSTTKTHRGSGQTACILEWPDGLPRQSTLDYLYNLILFLVTYLIPMIAMVCCYTAMGRELWGSRSIGELTQRQADSIRSKRKVVLMFLFIVIVFAVCWLPYHVYFIYTHHQKSAVYGKYVQHVYLGFYWLAMANSMLNPAIYYFMNPRFRDYFRKAICEWSCYLRRDNIGRLEGGETPPIRRYSHSGSKSRSGAGREGVFPPYPLPLRGKQPGQSPQSTVQCRTKQEFSKPLTNMYGRRHLRFDGKATPTPSPADGELPDAEERLRRTAPLSARLMRAGRKVCADQRLPVEYRPQARDKGD